jgi:hypothetical protein
MSKLVLFMPDGTTLDVPLSRERTTIGRRADNDICLPNLAVSGEHAVVVTILADSFLEDLGSTNGTLVNGNAIAKHFLRDRDHIDIGRHKLIYCVDDAATMNSEIVGLARINARDFGERVESARPFVRGRAVHAAPLAPFAGPASGAPATASVTSVKTHAPVPPRTLVDSIDAAAAPADAAPVPLAAPPAAASAAFKVLSGVNAGVSIPLLKAETTIGRPGVQVASVVKVGAGFRLKPLEGAAPPAVNGRPVDRDGIDLAPGDAVEIAGTQLQFIVAAADPARNDVAA